MHHGEAAGRVNGCRLRTVCPDDHQKVSIPVNNDRLGRGQRNLNQQASKQQRQFNRQAALFDTPSSSRCGDITL
jgi:hypothetical protein